MLRIIRLMFVAAAFAVVAGALLASLAKAADKKVADDAEVKDVVKTTALICLQKDKPDCCVDSGFWQSYSQPVCVGRLLRMRCEDGTYSDKAGWCKDVGHTYKASKDRMWK